MVYLVVMLAQNEIKISCQLLFETKCQVLNRKEVGQFVTNWNLMLMIGLSFYKASLCWKYSSSKYTTCLIVNTHNSSSVLKRQG